MKLKTKVGQIYLNHPKDENFTSVYQEVFSKSSRRVEIFIVIDVDAGGSDLVKLHKKDYDKLAQSIVANFKKTYVSSKNVDEETFEKALAVVNSSLAGLARNGKISWHGKLNVALGALHDSHLHISVTGNARVYLARNQEITLLSEELAENAPRPVKTFSNFSSGALTQGDRVIISTNQIFNFLSLERINDFLNEETLEETCVEVIESLADVKTAGFGAFIFEAVDSKESVARKVVPLTDQGAETVAETKIENNVYRRGKQKESVGKKILSSVWGIILRILKFFGLVIAGFFGLILSLVQGRGRKNKKIIVLAIIVIIIILLGSLGVSAILNSNNRSAEETEMLITSVEERLNDAEATLIFNDEGRTVTAIQEAENLLSELRDTRADEAKISELDSRLQDLKNKVNKEVRIENPEVLTQFPNIPTDLLGSPNGFLGYNKSSNSLAFYDFRTGETVRTLADQNTSNLVVGDFAGGNSGFVFFNKGGSFNSLGSVGAVLNDFPNEEASLDPNEVRIQDIAVFGAGVNPRLYLLDLNQNQIYRFNINQDEEGNATIGSAQNWLQEATSFTGSIDIAIDGNIYVLYPDHLDRYFAGGKEDFSLSSLATPLNNAIKVITSDSENSIYILDPDNERIVQFDKEGGLERQIISDRFREMSDASVDEENGIIYVLSGSELLQIDL